MVQKTEISQPKSAIALVSYKGQQDQLFLGSNSLISLFEGNLAQLPFNIFTISKKIVSNVLSVISERQVFFKTHQHLQE